MKTKTKARGEWLDARRHDVELAQARLGDVDGRCRWLLDDFTPTDPRTVSKSERALWRDNLMALVLGPGIGRGTWRWMTIGENEPLDEELHALWERVGRLVAVQQNPVLLPSLTGALAELPADPNDIVKTPYVRFARTYRAEDFESALLHAVADLLIACTHLRRCGGCDRLFVASRRQKRHLKCARRYWDSNRPSRRKDEREDSQSGSAVAKKQARKAKGATHGGL